MTTSVYLPKDSLALTLNGTTKWPSAKDCENSAKRARPPAKVRSILERNYEAIQDTAKEVHSYIEQHPEFEELGGGMLQAWENGSLTRCAASCV